MMLHLKVTILHALIVCNQSHNFAAAAALLLQQSGSCYWISLELSAATASSAQLSQPIAAAEEATSTLVHVGFIFRLKFKLNQFAVLVNLVFSFFLVWL